MRRRELPSLPSRKRRRPDGRTPSSVQHESQTTLTPISTPTRVSHTPVHALSIPLAVSLRWHRHSKPIVRFTGSPISLNSVSFAQRSVRGGSANAGPLSLWTRDECGSHLGSRRYRNATAEPESGQTCASGRAGTSSGGFGPVETAPLDDERRSCFLEDHQRTALAVRLPT